ncbi:MAG: biopolymer transporter ExbD [Sphingobacteriales bacterium]|nr:MAG: biopolymer transporter ExbD [Sphingobacteriales bacterium]
MAEIQEQSKRGGRSKATPRIDLTPMVDLGFLLITFFMMTTTMAKPKAMEIQMPFKPAPVQDGTVFIDGSAMTLLPAAGHKVYYYEGMYDPGKPYQVAENELALRSILQKKQKELAHLPGEFASNIQVLIKAHRTATVDDVVGIMDEMNILKVKYYAMVDIDETEDREINKLIGR